jgi:hypothetical protein
MAGFTGNDQIIQALSLGQAWKTPWSKNMNPTTAAAAGEWHTLFRGAGNPPADAIFNTGTNLVFNPLIDSTTSAGCIQHGGNVSPMYKFVNFASAVTAGGTTIPCQLCLVDVLGWVRVTSVTVGGAQSITNNMAAFSTFTAENATEILTGSFINLNARSRVRLTNAGGALPTGYTAGTDYFVIKLSDTTIKLASSYANAVAGTAVTISDDGTGTHTLNTILPRYTCGCGVDAILFNSNATAMGAATPSLTLGYTNSAQVASRATPAVLPIGKTAGANSLILYSGAAAAGKYNYAMPRQAGDAGVAEANAITLSTSYLSGEFSIALVKEILRLPLGVLGQSAERNMIFEYPSLPRIYDGAALYWMIGSGVNTPASTNFMGELDFVWN